MTDTMGEDRLRAWARVWKAKAKETRYWEQEMRESAKFWANQESDRLGQLLTAESERDALRKQVEAIRGILGVEWERDATDEGLFEFCIECDNVKQGGHMDTCERGRFFAALKEMDDA